MDTTMNKPIEDGGKTPSQAFLDSLNAADLDDKEETAAEVEEKAPEAEAAEEKTAEKIPAPAAEAEKTAETATSAAGEKDPYNDKETIMKAMEGLKTMNVPAQAGVVEEKPAEGEKPDEAEEDVFNSEEFMDKFYDNPAEAVKTAADKIAAQKVKEVVSGIEKRLKPLLDQSEEIQLKNEVRSVIGEFLNNNSDAKDYFPEMAKYIQEKKLDARDPKTYEDAYKTSKMSRQEGKIKELEDKLASGTKSLDDYLADEESVKRISGDERVKNKIIEEYLKGLNNGNAPQTIGANGTMNPSATPANKAKTMDEARRMLISRLSQ